MEFYAKRVNYGVWEERVRCLVAYRATTRSLIFIGLCRLDFRNCALLMGALDGNVFSTISSCGEIKSVPIFIEDNLLLILPH